MGLPQRTRSLLRMGFERLRVYQAAVRLRAEVDRLRTALSPEPAYKSLFAHVEEAADSIENNIAEGSSSVHPGKQANFFDIALGSADEVRSGLRSLHSRGAFGECSIYRAIGLCLTIGKMLKEMIRKLRVN